jgi:hypothetical protein
VKFEIRDLKSERLNLTVLLVGTARCTVRAAYQRRNVRRESHALDNSFRPLLRGRGQRTAM